MEQKPSIGRTLRYTLSARDVEAINRRRVAEPYKPEWPKGAQAHVGSSATAGEEVALYVTRVWTDTCVNGQVLLDGNDSLWVTSVTEGTAPGTWRWPPRV
jgi:hypothetical protein